MMIFKSAKPASPYGNKNKQQYRHEHGADHQDTPDFLTWVHLGNEVIFPEIMKGCALPALHRT